MYFASSPRAAIAFIIAVIIVIVVIIIIVNPSFCILLNNAVTAFEIFPPSTPAMVSEDHSECNL